MKNGFKGLPKLDERILFIAYPLLPVTENSSGGAEQVLWTLQRELATRGAKITVAACSESEVTGSLFATGAPANGSLTSARMHETRLAAQCLELLRVREMIGAGFDIVHDHSGSFFAQGNGHRTQVPTLATLHLPRSFYPAGCFERVRPTISFNWV